MHYVVLVLAAGLRLIPHPWNVTPIGAIGLFAGTWCDRRIAWLIPLIPLFIGDAIRGFYQPLIMLSVYLGFALSAVVGQLFLAKKRNATRFASAIFVNALIFFCLSNAAVWWVYYPHSVSGLVQCYVNGLPYFGYTLVGDSLFVAIIFGLYELARRVRLQVTA